MRLKEYIKILEQRAKQQAPAVLETEILAMYEENVDLLAQLKETEDALRDSVKLFVETVDENEKLKNYLGPRQVNVALKGGAE